MYISEHLNLHDYIWELNDVAYILADATTIRNGIILDIVGTTYTILMEDTSENEIFNNPKLFPLHSNAKIYADEFLITPTPSISVSASPSTSRTPSATLTPTPTPSSSLSNPPNLLKNITWTAINGTATSDSEENYSFSSSINDIGSVKFTTTLTVTAGETYTFSTRYTENTISYASIQFKTSSDIILNSNNLGGSGQLLNTIIIPTGITSVIVTVQLFVDSNYNNPPPINYVYKLHNVSFKKNVSTSSGQTYDQVILAKNPIAYWPLNTNSTDVISGNNLTLHPNVELVSDFFGNQLVLANSSSAPYGAITNNVISLTNNYSLEAWFYIETLIPGNSDGYSTIFGTNDPDDNTYGVQYFSNGTLFVAGFNDSILMQGYKLQPNVQYHMVMTVDVSGNVIFYINGNTYYGNAPSVDTYLYGYIGNNQDGEYLVGIIGNPAIYDYALTSQQTMENYIAGTTNYRYSSAFITPTPTISITPTNTPTPTPSPLPIPKFIARLNSDGSLDNTFTDLNTDYAVTSVYQISDNKIYVGGNFTSIGGETYNDLARLNSDGTLDTTFTSLNSVNPVNCIKQMVDTKIYVGGGFTILSNSSRGLARFSADGTLDASYTHNLGFVDGSPGVTALVQTSDDKIYIGGDITYSGYTNMARLDSDGTLDTTFTNIEFNATVNSIYQTIDDKIYVSGHFTAANSYDYLIRLNSDGTIDNTFINGSVTTTAAAIIQTSDGKIYVGTYNGIVRLNSDGTLDETYTIISAYVASNFYQTSDGKIYVGNYFSNYVRLNSDGTLDTLYNAPAINGQAITYQTNDNSIYIGYSHI